jgi:hypothetical protein
MDFQVGRIFKTHNHELEMFSINLEGLVVSPSGSDMKLTSGGSAGELVLCQCQAQAYRDML